MGLAEPGALVAVRIVFEVAGDRQINREILHIGEHAGDAAPAFSAIADYMMNETAEQFATQGQHASDGWAPLKFSTLREKQKAGFGSRGILERTLALEDSLTRRKDPNQVLEIRPDSLIWGSKLPYALVHQRPKPGNPLPRRRPIEFTETARKNIVRILQRYVITGEVAGL